MTLRRRGPQESLKGQWACMWPQRNGERSPGWKRWDRRLGRSLRTMVQRESPSREQMRRGKTQQGSLSREQTKPDTTRDTSLQTTAQVESPSDVRTKLDT